MRSRAFADGENLRGYGRADRVAALARRLTGRVRNRREKTWGIRQLTDRGGWRGVREIERAKVPVDSIPKAHPALRESAKLRLRTSRGAYTVVVQNAKMVMLIERIFLMNEKEISARVDRMTREEQESRIEELNQKLGITSPHSIAGGKNPPPNLLEEAIERDYLKKVLGYSNADNQT